MRKLSNPLNSLITVKVILLFLLILIYNNLRAQIFMINDKDSTVKMIGYLQKEVILGKDQKTISYEDYYFYEKGSSERVFIKLSESKTRKEVIDSFLYKNSDQLWVSEEVEVIGTFRNGAWDGADKMNTNINLQLVPGRNGKYLIIDNIVIKGGEDYLEYAGRIIKKVQINKAGRKLKTFDLFFVVGNEQYFIKGNEQTVARKQLESLLNDKEEGSFESEIIKIQCEIKNGLWDTDNPMHQSRVGKFILIYKIVE